MGESDPPAAAANPPRADAGRPAPPSCMMHARRALRKPGDFNSAHRPTAVSARLRAVPAAISRTSVRSDRSRRSIAGSTSGAVARTLAEAACAAMFPTAEATCATSDAEDAAAATASALIGHEALSWRPTSSEKTASLLLLPPAPTTAPAALAYAAAEVGTPSAATSAGNMPSVETTRAAMAGMRVSNASAAAAGTAASTVAAPPDPTAASRLVIPPSAPSATHTAVAQRAARF